VQKEVKERIDLRPLTPKRLFPPIRFYNKKWMMTAEIQSRQFKCQLPCSYILIHKQLDLYEV
jgi:hypothetical protein